MLHLFKPVRVRRVYQIQDYPLRLPGSITRIRIAEETLPENSQGLDVGE